MKRKGTVVQVTGPVVDVAFEGGSLPEINEALSVAPDGQVRMMEVAQHIGGDTVRREEMKVAGLQPSINMILPYATPKLSGCSREALVEFSACCIENSRDLLQVLEAEYRKQYAKNLTLSRLSEAVILPLCPDKGSCMEYDENLAASVYLENDLETLWRMKEFLIKG